MGGNGSENGGNDTVRTEAFSDEVFAIAITLLVIEIGVPHLGDEPEGTTLVGALMDWWPSYLGYVISFLVIGTV
ncbi:MAG: TMEM175 family protein [Actinomycetota bacterium]|nr:TMEM175 family protein [Actinomycetota bacterium]